MAVSYELPIAIVGYGGVFPGASDLDQFWRNIVECRDAASDPPAGRWLLEPSEVLAERVCCDRVYTTRGCFVDPLPEVALPRHADGTWLERLDPMYRLVLAAGIMAWRGVRHEPIASHRGGVVLGSIVLPTDAASALGDELLLPAFEAALWNRYGPRAAASGATRHARPLRTDPLNRWVSGLPATLLAWSLGLQGASMTLDAACASSLFAVKLACDALRQGRADVMLAGGASRPDSLYTQMGFCQLRALSASGRCAPLDAGADGLLVGEGAGVVVLKRLADAVAHGDTIHGVIRGAGWSNDTGGNLMAPDARGQLRAMRAAYQQAGWRPDDVELIECHGTGTPLGDRTELESLAALWDEQDRARRHCVLGSVKGNIGHLLTGAGAAGLIKVLLAWRHETLPPTAHFERPWPGSALARRGSPLRVLKAPQPWPPRADGPPRRAAVSAFGFGGTNAHLLIEQWQGEAGTRGQTAVRIPKLADGGAAGQQATHRTAAASTENGGGEESLVAIVGLGARYGPWRDADALMQHALQPDEPWRARVPDPSGERFGHRTDGYYLTELDVAVRRFRIAPQTLKQMLPQQVAMLLAAAEALEEAGLAEAHAAGRRDAHANEPRQRMGVFVGIELDMNTTGYRFRWSMAKRARAWAERLGVQLSDDALARWTTQLRDAASDPLTAERTMGGLGSIVASRLAKVFRAGGPSFTVSGGETSGLRALELAADALRNREIDMALVGAVDMAGDLRHVEPLKQLVGAREHEAHHRTLVVGEGAAAVVLKRLGDARRDGDQVYAVVRNVVARRGPIAAWGRNAESPESEGAAARDEARGSRTGASRCDGPTLAGDDSLLHEACRPLRLAPDSLGYVEHVSPFGGGLPRHDETDERDGPHRNGRRRERVAERLCQQRAGSAQCRSDLAAAVQTNTGAGVARLTEAIGHGGAASGLLALLRAAVCLNDERLPRRVIGNTTQRAGDSNATSDPDAIRTEATASSGSPASVAGCYWLRNREDGPRRAAVWAEAVDGTQCVAVLEAVEAPNPCGRGARQRRGTGTPPGSRATARPRVRQPIESLWLLEGDTPGEILQRLDTLSRWIDRAGQPDVGRLAPRWYEAHPTDARRQLAVALVAGSIDSFRQRLQMAKTAVARGQQYGLDGVFYEPRPLGGNAPLGYVFPGSGSHYPGMGRELCLAWPEVARRHDRENGRLADQFAGGRFWSDADAANFSPLDVIFGQVCFGTLAYDVLDCLGVRPQAVLGYSLGESAALFATRTWDDRDEMLRRALRSDLFTRQLAGPCLAARQTWKLPDHETVDWHVAVLAAPADKVKPALANYPRAYLLIENTPEQCVVGGQRVDVERVIEQLGCVAIPVSGVTTVHCEVARAVAEAYRALHTFDVAPAAGIRVYSAAWGRAYEVTREQAARSILEQAVGPFDFTRLVCRAYDDGVRLFVELGPGDSCTRMVGQILGSRPHLACAVSSASRRESTSLLHAVAQLAVHRKRVDLQGLWERMRRGPGQPRWSVHSAEPQIRLQPARGPFVVPPPPAPAATATTHDAARTGAMAQTKTGLVASAAQQRQQTPAPTAGRDRDAAPQPGATGAVDFATTSASSLPALAQPNDQPNNMSRPAAAQPMAARVDADGPTLDAVWAHMMRTSEAHAAAHGAFLRLAEQTSRALRDIAALQYATTAAAPTMATTNDGAPSGVSAAGVAGTSQHGGSLQPLASNAAAVEPAGADAARVEAAVVQEVARSAERSAANPRSEPRRVVWNRQQCLEFAVGSIAKVFGPEFAEVDGFPTRVRLPDEPLMLVDRVTHVEGEPRSMRPGRLVTEHDVRDDWWYLDGGRMVSGVAIEAGQADLMLSAFLGADFQTRGRAVYRLLDAAVAYHRSLPEPGETVVYDIRIRRFFRQGDTHLFRFEFDATVDDRPLMTMRDGCAGFFTPKQLSSGQGIVQTPLERRPQPGRLPDDWRPLVPLEVQSLDDRRVDALRQGDLAEAFGPAFAGLGVGRPATIPDGRLGLLRRVPRLEPAGGRFGLGRIVAEADVRPDDWYLGCHFVDDQVMPGTLMYECALHALRIFLLRLGWVGSVEAGVVFEPVPGVTSRLRCRGQVTAETRRVQYEVAIKELGYDGAQGTPYAIADGLMHADGRPIVAMNDMSLRCSGLTRHQIEALWRRTNPRGGQGAGKPNTRAEARGDMGRDAGDRPPGGTVDDARPASKATATVSTELAARAEAKPRQVEERTGASSKVLFDRRSFLEFARGKPSRAFGQRYQPFDQGRFIARLPAPPFQFMDRVTRIEGCRAWELAAGGTVCVEYDVPRDAWYFAANRQPRMPLAVLLEVALQPCGWMAAYLGSALRSRDDLAFRNLGGQATQLAQVAPETGTLVTTVRMTNVSQSAGMIIENFEFDVRTRAGQPVYHGNTYFGFFTRDALAQQAGIRDAAPYEPGVAQRERASTLPYPSEAPLPEGMLRMVDQIGCYLPEGGPHGLGWIEGASRVDPEAWFFKAHFFQDPVWPGSLGLESLVELLKVAAHARWGTAHAQATAAPAVAYEMAPGQTHRWQYRGQVLPTHRKVIVQAIVTQRDDTQKRLAADGWLFADGRAIYRMEGFALRVVDCS